MKTWLALILPLTVFGADHAVDLTPTIVYPQLEDKSSFELDYRIVNDFASGYTIVNPRFKPMGEQNFSTSLGIGHRIDFEAGLFGFHLFGDHSYIEKCHFLQLGPSIEFLGSKWEGRFNGYFPVHSFEQKGQKIVTAHKYFDTEIVYKWKYADLGLSHNYDLKTGKHGAVGRISVPVGYSTISLSGGIDGIHGKHVKLSFTFEFPVGDKPMQNKSVNRHVGLVYDIQKIKPVKLAPQVKPVIAPPAVVKVPEIVKDIEKVADDFIDKEANALIEKELDPTPTNTWWSFFFNGRSKPS